MSQSKENIRKIMTSPAFFNSFVDHAMKMEGAKSLLGIEDDEARRVIISLMIMNSIHESTA